ncbi:histidine phosphatase family protein [Halorubrum sp. Boch-26]|uniref:histidine phosphatase family protein n=1 Tax=Halorubrum sp. Boch-26 TaxID=2994426 RepID=UPI002468FAD4|nr:histidine phosphatase family protein [Halorubrum sp. Boch-26]
MSTLFVRHGTTEWNETGRIQGWAPVGLSDAGCEEAAAVADALAERHAVDAVVASDLARTVETAEPIAAAAGVDVETDPRLRERDFGVFQGLTSGDFFERFPAFDLLENGRAAAERAPDSGENWLAVRERVLDAVADLRAREGTVVAVTHVNPIRLAVGERRGLSVVRSLTELSADNCSVTEVDEGGALVRADDRSYK